MSTPFMQSATHAATTPSVFAPASAAASAVVEVSWVLIIGAAILFAGTMLLLAVALRRRAAQVHVTRWLIGGGLVLPVVVLTTLFIYSVHRSPPWKSMAPPDALIVSVTGRMWWWEIRYRDPATGADIVTANELRMPVGRPVYLGLSSAEVIHSLWIPQLGGKMDLVPGRINHLLLNASQPGVYRGQCAEFCGEAHAHMAIHAVAMPPAEFDAWLAGQALPARLHAPAPPGPSADAMRLKESAALQLGQRVFQAQRCNACHTVRGVSEGARLAPDLTHIGSRLHLAAGTVANDAAGMKHWLANVHAVKPGTRMPSYGRLDHSELEALSQWLLSLQ